MKTNAFRALMALLAIVSPLAAQTSAAPDLVVLIAVDQLRTDYLERFRPQFTAGLKRLLDGGAYFPNAFHDHAVTHTAVGHATMLSGRFPRSHGIISNRRGVPDPQFARLGDTVGASPYRFRGSTLIDWLRTRDPLSRALSVSFKDRGAILPLGRAKQSVFWWADNSGNFTTSRYYADTLPTWVREFNQQRLGEIYDARPWTLLLEPGAYPEPDSVAWEDRGREVAFPHTKLRVRYTPWSDELTTAFALRGVNALKLGGTGHVDLLAVSFSATDEIGHRFGPDSREIHDQLLRLDHTIGVLLDSIFARFTPEQVVIALTSDHGVTTFPRDAKAVAVDTVPAMRAVRAVLRDAGVPDDAVFTETGMLMFRPELFRSSPSLMDSVTATFVRSVRRLAGVALVESVAALAGKAAGNDALTRRWQQMLPPDLPIAAVITLKPGYNFATVTTAQHGSAHDSDTQVPMLFYGTRFKAGIYREVVRTVDIAPTLATLLGVPPTETLDGKPLTQVIK